MSSITLVRHGQASIASDDYDQLSSLGQRQSLALGDYWGSQGRTWCRLLIGPLKRHEQTWHAFAEGYRRHGAALPDPEIVDGMREHQAIRVVDHVLDGANRTQQSKQPTKAQKLAFFQQFDRVMRDWVAQRLSLPAEWETWQQARQRARQTMQSLLENDADETLAFTSGGFVSMAVGEVLQLSDEKVYELSLEVVNSAWCELRYGLSGLSLKHFNWHPHLADPDWVTLV